MKFAVLLCLLIPSLACAGLPISDADRVFIDFETEISPESASAFINALQASKNAREIDILINTPGGSLGAVFAMSRALEEAAGHQRIVCTVDGGAVSAGLFLLESCPVRRMTARSVLMAHEGWFTTDEPQTVDGLKRELARLVAWNHIYAAHCAARMKISTQEFERRTRDLEWWIQPEEALKVGAIDQIVPSPNEALRASSAD